MSVARIFLTSACVLAVLALALLRWWPETAAALWPRLAPGCPWQTWTGVPCPTCGASRAAAALAAGQWRAALGANPLAALAILALAPVTVAAWVWPWRRARVRGRALVYAATGAVVVNWIYLLVIAHR